MTRIPCGVVGDTQRVKHVNAMLDYAARQAVAVIPTSDSGRGN